MRVLITGGSGQLAHELATTAPSLVALRLVSRAECDITESTMVEKVFEAFRPDIVINTAAYTGVDAAEDNRDQAFRVNARGAENVAIAAELIGSRLIHISTDYVFDGHRSTPYPPDAAPNPLNVYGASKLQGEELTLAAARHATIVRTGWLYSTRGNNFLVRILTALQGPSALRVVCDQQGCPTSAYEFALTIWKMLGISLPGIYHWANSGAGSWYDFASEIARIGQELELFREHPEIRAITTDEYARRANRPPYSVLDPTKLAGALEVSPTGWQRALQNDMTRGFETLSVSIRRRAIIS